MTNDIEICYQCFVKNTFCGKPEKSMNEYRTRIEVEPKL